MGKEDVQQQIQQLDESKRYLSWSIIGQLMQYRLYEQQKEWLLQSDTTTTTTAQKKTEQSTQLLVALFGFASSFGFLSQSFQSLRQTTTEKDATSITQDIWLAILSIVLTLIAFAELIEGWEVEPTLDTTLEDSVLDQETTQESQEQKEKQKEEG